MYWDKRKNAHKILVRKSKRNRKKYEDNIQMD